MRLVTYTRLGVPSIGVEMEGGVLDIPEAASRFGRKYQIHGKPFPSTMIELLKWESGLNVVRQIVESYSGTSDAVRPLIYDYSKIKYKAPLLQPGKIVALGLNYEEHIEETGSEVPDFPVIFAKFPSTIIGPNDAIRIPRIAKEIDWEIELAIIIGKDCKDVKGRVALDYVAGYTIINDVSARDLQFADVQFVRSKSMDTFCPMGPRIVTTDELGDASGLYMYTKVNDIIKQESNTSNLLHNVPKIISYLSQSFTLEPGDVIATGTPGGVGNARDPKEFLKPGDEVEMHIDKIGTLKNHVDRA